MWCVRGQVHCDSLRVVHTLFRGGMVVLLQLLCAPSFLLFREMPNLC